MKPAPVILLPFVVPPSAEAVCVTHVLELRRDLNLPDEMRLLVVLPRSDALANWSREAKGRLVGIDPGVTFAVGGDDMLDQPGFGPTLVFEFRRVYSHERPYWHAALFAFDELFKVFADPKLIEPVLQIREDPHPHGMFDWISVVSVTSFVATDDWPGDAEGQAALIGDRLDAALDNLNDYLIALCLARHDFAIGPVARGDLPHLTPVVLEAVRAEPTGENARAGVMFFSGIHSNPEFPRPQPRSFDEMDENELLASLVARANFFGQEPFFLFFELMQDAIRQFNNARYSPSVIWVGSAVEVAIATALRESGIARAIPEADIERVLTFPFRNVVEDHLSRFVVCDVDLTDQANAFGKWWQGGYQRRNDVVHRGHRATRQEAWDTLEDGNALVGALRAGLAADPTTASVAESLHWGPRDKPDDKSD